MFKATKKLNAVLSFVTFLKILTAQTPTEKDSLCIYIDSTKTERISEPIEVDTSNNKITVGKVLLGATAALGIPLTTGIAILSLFPPSFVVVENLGIYNNGIGFETAIGYGDTTKLRFSKQRLIFQYSYIDNFKSRVLLAINRDFLLRKFGPAEIFGFGFSVGIFGWTNFNGVNTVGVETSVWLGNAMNIPYLLLFPQHHLFIKFRRGFELGSRFSVNEINIGFSSSFTLKKSIPSRGNHQLPKQKTQSKRTVNSRITLTIKTI
ncbi:MAG: hypothetical protein ACK44H_04040 [Candidatus Kryptonium sp.]